MITVLDTGRYKLIETKAGFKILTLGSNVFAWIDAKGIGEILVASHVPHKADHVLAIGNYRLYDVADDLILADQQHLELSIGEGQWQGYLLPTGLPSGAKKRSRIIPTQEVISRYQVSNYYE